MLVGTRFLDDNDERNRFSRFARTPESMKDEDYDDEEDDVGQAFLADSDEEEKGFISPKPLILRTRDNQHDIAKSFHEPPVNRLVSSQGEQTVSESRYVSEFLHITHLGRGGFGSVELVRNKLDRGLYALKRIRFRKRRRDGKLGEKLMREIRAMNELSHPNIVRYHASWIEEDPTPHGTPSSSAERGEKLFEFREEDEDEEDEGFDGEDGDELEDSESRVVNGDDDDDEGDDDDDGEYVRGDDSSSTTNDTSLSNVSPFEMEEDKKERRRGRKKKRAPPSPRSWIYGTLYIQMQYYEETLDAWLDSPERKKHVCCHVSRDIFMQIVEALHYIHSRGYIHRDLKPANIFLTPRKEEGPPVGADVCKCEVCGANGCGRGYVVSIGDFGLTTFSQKASVDSGVSTPTQPNDSQPIRESNSTKVFSSAIPVPVSPAKNREHQQPFAASVGSILHSRLSGAEVVNRCRSNSRNSPSLSKHTTGVGSLSYASPEQINGQFYEEKTDVFSLGIICYQLFAPPFFTRMERANEFEKLRSGKISSKFCSAHPKEADFIRSCLALNPADRPSTTDILAMDIWEPAPCMCLRDSSYAVTIPRSMLRRMQDEISRLQLELAATKEQLARATGRSNPLTASNPLDAGRAPSSPRRVALGRNVSKQTRNSDLPKLFG